MSDVSFAVGIDLGTSTSEICVYRTGKEIPEPIPDPSQPSKSPIVPSLVAIDNRGELKVGEAARNIVDRSGYGIREVKREMGSGRRLSLGNREFRPEEVSALILKRLKENAEIYMGKPVRDVVLSVPANFPDAARQATKDAGDLAGLNVLRLINEPTAAAMAFGVEHIDTEAQLVVFDFGGGTLDITALEMIEGVLDVKCSFGDPKLGGKDFDDILIDLILSKFESTHRNVQITDPIRKQLKNRAELAKIMLSTHRSESICINNFMFIGGEPIDLEVDISRAEFEQAAAPLLERARVCTKSALDSKGITKEAVDIILLVGGTTYLPMVRQLVAEIFGREPMAEVNPNLAVAIGATMHAAAAARIVDDHKNLVLADVAPLRLGIDVVNYMSTNQVITVFEPLIEANTKIPYITKKNYSLFHENQQQVTINLFQDPSGRAQLPEQAIFTGQSGSINDIPPATNGMPREVEIEFSYDLDGIARLRAKIPATDREVTISHEITPHRLHDSERALAKQNVLELWEMNPDHRNHMGLIRKAERLLPNLVYPNNHRLEIALIELKGALGECDDSAVAYAEKKLTDLLIELAY